MIRMLHRNAWRLMIGMLALAMLGLVAPQAWRLKAPAPQKPLSGKSAQPAAASSPPPAVLQVAPVGPLVAELIELDPSLPETPAVREAHPYYGEGPTLTASRNRLELSTVAADIQPRLVDSREAEPQGPGSLADEPLREPAEPPAPSPEVEPPEEVRFTEAWPFPTALVEQLNLLATTTPAAANWAERVKVEVDGLAAAPSLNDTVSANQLIALDRLAEEGRVLASSLNEEQGRSRVLRAGYSVYRRLNVWKAVHRLAVRGEASAGPLADAVAWQQSLADVDQRLQATGLVANWRAYLLLDRAETDIDSSACSPADQRELARDILYRLHSTQLTQEQSRFLCAPPFDAFAEQLAARAVAAPDYRALLTTIEAHEHNDASLHSRALADHYDTLRWSHDAGVRELAETVNVYYRNANVRVAFAAALINRMIPPQQPQHEIVQDKILEADVYGESYTNTQLRLVLIPDANRWNLGLEANGAVSSDTSSTKGPATFYQLGKSFFRARKRVTVDQRGIRLFRAEAGVNANNELQDFETDFDGIPLLSNFARSMARSQYDEAQPAARQEVEGKIRWRATSQLDREVAEKLEKGKQDFQVRFIKPLQDLDLDPTTVDMETTAERLIGRLRLAGRDQVAAHTPRPQAPGDSLLSVQIHETAFNNALENLHFEGQRYELHDLYKEMTTRFDPTPQDVPEDLPEDVHVTFADEDAVRIDCQDGRVRLTIRIKELSHKRSHWHDFTVRGYYAPNADQLEANLVRDGIIELIGDKEQPNIASQIALRGIFGRVLSRNRQLSLVNKQIAEAPELRDLQVTQFIIHDGWIGVALGPKFEGRQAAMYPRPKTEEEAESE